MLPGHAGTLLARRRHGISNEERPRHAARKGGPAIDWRCADHAGKVTASVATPLPSLARGLAAGLTRES